MKTKNKKFGDLKLGDEFYAIEMNFEDVTKRKVIGIVNTFEDTDNTVTLEIVRTDSTDYENESYAISFPKDFSLYGRFNMYATTIEITKKFIKSWEKRRRKEIKDKANKMMELLTKNE